MQSTIVSPQAVCIGPTGVEWSKNPADLGYVIMSVTKAFTTYFALQGGYLTNMAAPRTVFAGSTASPLPANNVTKGDEVTIGDLFYAAMLSSSNTAAEDIAYVSVGGTHSSHLSWFVGPMNDYYANQMGMTGIDLRHPAGMGTDKASAQMVAELLQAIDVNQPWLRTVMGTLTDTFTVTGANSRTVTVAHNNDFLATDIPAGTGNAATWEGSKGGSGTGTYAIGAFWDDPNGDRHYLSVIGAPSEAQRTTDMLTIINDVLDEMGTPTDTPVTANTPTADDTANTITWTPLTGVQYVIGGSVRTSPYSVGDVTTSVTVTAQATPGYVLTGTSSWTFSFTGSDPDPSGLFATDGSPIVLHLTNGDPITLT